MLPVKTGAFHGRTRSHGDWRQRREQELASPEASRPRGRAVAQHAVVPEHPAKSEAERGSRHGDTAPATCECLPCGVWRGPGSSFQVECTFGRGEMLTVIINPFVHKYCLVQARC